MIKDSDLYEVFNAKHELYKLEKRKNELEKRLKEIESPRSLAYRTKLKPFGLPGLKNGNIEDDATFGHLYNSNAWNCFKKLGKLIHTKNGVFVQRKKDSIYPDGCDETLKTNVQKISDLTSEEADISAEMIDRMIEIYNEYMVKLHPYIICETRSGTKFKKYVKVGDAHD